jgi:hypothetical protein
MSWSIESSVVDPIHDSIPISFIHLPNLNINSHSHPNSASTMTNCARMTCCTSFASP